MFLVALLSFLIVVLDSAVSLFFQILLFVDRSSLFLVSVNVLVFRTTITGFLVLAAS